MDPSQNPNVFHATTIVCVRRDDKVAIAGDGQVTLGHTVMKGNARKVRRLGRRALLAHTQLDARTIATEAIGIAGDICIYTNRNVVVEEL